MAISPLPNHSGLDLLLNVFLTTILLKHPREDGSQNHNANDIKMKLGGLSRMRMDPFLVLMSACRESSLVPQLLEWQREPNIASRISNLTKGNSAH